MKITDYEKVQALAASNIFLLDGPNGTKTIAADALAKALIGLLSSKDFIGGVNLSELTQINELVSGNKLLVGTTDGNKAIAAEDALFTIFSSVLASSGLWAYLQKKSEQKDVKTEMLIGLAHDRIMYLGMSYIDRGCVTQDEYENLRVYLYEPYERMGGNGSAKRIMQEVDKLPIHKFIEKEEEHNEHE